MEVKNNKIIYKKYRSTARAKIGSIIKQKCRICKKWKKLSDFDREIKYRMLDNGKIKKIIQRRTKCKECQKSYFKYWYEKNKEYKKACSRDYDRKKKDKDYKSDFVLKSVKNETLLGRIFHDFKLKNKKIFFSEYEKARKRKTNIEKQRLEVWNS